MNELEGWFASNGFTTLWGKIYDINDAIHHQEVDIDEFGRFLVSSYEKHASVTCHDFIPAKRHRNAPGQLHTCFSGQGIFI